uniref:Late embryogenesis abundant protein LEA-2 subgroup domain-containing protein n=1 Tax=Kalanchoe fedtschenkoi TaxID=63787 RepID=A0A7N0V3H0_KALFE
MADNKQQTHLNGAFYGPSIPPPNNTYHRPGGHRSSGRNCLCSLFCLLFKIIVALVIIIGLAILIFWLIFRPTNLKFHVTDATLTQFDLSNNTLRYNLALNLTARNPNRRVGVYYNKIDARAYYAGQRFGSVPLDAFYQGRKNTSVWRPVFQGQNLVLLSGADLNNFNAEKSTGVYSIDVRVHLRLRLKFGRLKTPTMTPKIKCDLKVPLSGSGLVSFQTTKCDLDM